MTCRAPWFVGQRAAHRTLPVHSSSSDRSGASQTDDSGKGSLEESTASSFTTRVGPSAREQRKIITYGETNEEEDHVVPPEDPNTASGEIIYITSSKSEKQGFHNLSSSIEMNSTESSDNERTISQEFLKETLPFFSYLKNNLTMASSSNAHSGLATSKARKRRLRTLVQKSLKKKKINIYAKVSASEPSFLHGLGQRMDQSQLGCATHKCTMEFEPGTSFTLFAWSNTPPAPEPDHTRRQLFPISGYLGTSSYLLIHKPWAFIAPWASWLFILFPAGFHFPGSDEINCLFSQSSIPIYISRSQRPERLQFTPNSAQSDAQMEYIVEELEENEGEGLEVVSIAEEIPRGYGVQYLVQIEEVDEEDDDTAPLEDGDLAPLEADVDADAPLKVDPTTQSTRALEELKAHVEEELFTIKEVLFKIIDRLP